MLARRSLPDEYRAWNRRWGAPFGRPELVRKIAHRIPGLAARYPQLGGPFSVQSNNDSREVEYPWAFHATPVTNGMAIVEIGGGLSGFQFVLAKSGARVINVDPGEEATGVGFYCTPAGIDRLNRAFRTDVRLVNTTLDQAGLADGSIDTIYSISTIEHIPESELPGVAAEMRRILRPGGHIVLTIDLFLDLAPFTGGTRNRYGWNIDVKRLVDHLGCELVIGDEAELYGYPAFRAEHVLEQLPELLYGVGYPACAQLLMLAKSRERIARDPDDHFGVARGTLEGSRPDVPLVGALSERGRPVGPHGDRRAEASLSAPAGKEARPHCPSAQGCPHSSPRRQWGRSSVGPVALRQRVYR